jgi:hypothetical protein
MKDGVQLKSAARVSAVVRMQTGCETNNAITNFESSNTIANLDDCSGSRN